MALTASTQDIAQKLVSSGPVKTEKTPKRIRGQFNNLWIFDTISSVYIWEHPYYPYLYIPIKDVKGLEKGREKITGEKGTAFVSLIEAAGRVIHDVILWEGGELDGLVRVGFEALDSWYIEEERIYQHPKDPYKRVDPIPSSREIRIVIDGVEIAKSTNNVFLFESLLPPRYYLPKTGVAMKYLSPSETTSLCPYKGMANYYNVTVNGKEYKDYVWWYRYPTLESTLVAGRLCFYNEKVDIFVDGVLETRPKTFF